LTEFKERRRFPRAEVSLELPGLGEVRNISADGLWVLLQRPERVGALLDLEFRLLPEGPLIKCKGEVIWLGYQKMAGGRTEAGLKFVDLAEPDRNLIDEYVQSQYHH
jgi:hypothetical protein